MSIEPHFELSQDAFSQHRLCYGTQRPILNTLP